METKDYAGGVAAKLNLREKDVLVVLELLAMAGLFQDVMQDIEAQAGPTRLRDLAQATP